MKFETIHKIGWCACFLLLAQGGSANKQAWSTNYQSYNSQLDVNKPVTQFADPVKNTVVEPQQLSEVPRAKKEAVAPAAEQSMYYYETYPSSRGHPQQQQFGQQQEAQKTAHYPTYTYDASASNYNPTYYYHHPTDTEHRQDFIPDGDDGDGGDGGGGLGSLGGLAGLIGLLGLKGIKGLATLSPLLLALPFLPVLLPALLPIILGALAIPLILLLLPLLLLLFVPIPVIVIPPTLPAAPGARSLADFSVRTVKLSKVLPELAAEVLESGECVERVACEVARGARGVHMGGWVDKVTAYLPKEGKYTKRILKGVKPGDTMGSSRKTADSECEVYACEAKSILARHVGRIQQ